MPSPAGALIVALLLGGPPGPAAAPASAEELLGLWKARQWFGPEARGPLVLQRAPGGFSADFLGRVHPVRDDRGELAFDLAGGEGSFRGRVHSGGRAIRGQWIGPPSRVHGSRYASPLVLEADGPDRWRGEVVPRDDTFTLYLMVRKRPDGTVGAFLRNPERNIGVFYDVDHLVRTGPSVGLVGRRRGAASESALLGGSYDPESQILSVAFPERGGTYDFRRDPDEQSGFYPRGKHPGRYAYRPPPARDDGWPTGTLEEADLDRATIEKVVQAIVDSPIESVHAPQIEGLLVARRGKLVLEEYFHGEHRDKLHETRSAAKSLTATLVGAALQAGAKLELSTPVYQVMGGGAFPEGLEARKRAMTLEHLLSMRSGYFCDDSNPDAPGNEDAMLDQAEEPDYLRYTLEVPMDSAPGERSVYCSINPNLALGVLARATAESPLDLFDRLLAAPLKIGHYGWPLDPAGQPYGGGGVQFLPRDFMKLGQLMLEGGAWKGRRILGPGFASRAGSPLHDLRGIQYGYLWWSIEYRLRDRPVRAFFAGGNGGQTVMVFPELELVIAAYAGNYSDRVGLRIQQDLVPNAILPAVREGRARL